MKRLVSVLLCATIAFGPLASSASAGVNIERQSAENPMVEIFKSTIYGALTGAVVGGVIVLAANENADTNRNIMRWSLVAGTVVGLGVGMYFTAKRPQPSSLLEFRNDGLALHAVAPQIEPGGRMTMRLVGVRF
jgi:hypothetical protein